MVQTHIAVVALLDNERRLFDIVRLWQLGL